MHAGSPLEDILRVLTTSVTVSIRRTHLDDLLQYYLQSLTDRLSTTSIKNPFDIESLRNAYSRLLCYSIVTAKPCLYILASIAHSKGQFDQCELLIDRIEALLDDLFADE